MITDDQRRLAVALRELAARATRRAVPRSTRKRIAQRLARIMADAMHRTRGRYRAGLVVSEESFTEHFAAVLSEEIDRLREAGAPVSLITPEPFSDEWPQPSSIGIGARPLTSHGTGAEERTIGADLVTVLDINLPGWQVTKGFLMQAKVPRNEARVAVDHPDKLTRQCADMLDRTDDAYVFVYGKDTIRVMSALEVKHRGDLGLDALPYSGPDEFFSRFTECELGDTNIRAIDKPSLAALREQMNARRALAVSVKRSARPVL